MTFKKVRCILPQASVFLIPRSSALSAAYQYNDGRLAACSGQDDIEQHLPAARTTLAVWDAAQRLERAALMVLKSKDAVSIGTLNGGVIVEGRDQLNIGLVRAATRGLDPIRTTTAAKCHFKSDDRFRSAFWAVITRLHGAVLPRTFQFELAGTRGTITSKDNKFVCAGDFTNPHDFIGELRAACQIEEQVAYSLAATEDTPAGASFDLSDLIKEVTPVDPANTYTFDKDGWPLTCRSEPDFGMMRTLSAMACALRTRGDTTVTVFSGDNSKIVSGSLKVDQDARFLVH